MDILHISPEHSHGSSQPRRISVTIIPNNTMWGKLAYLLCWLFIQIVCIIVFQKQHALSPPPPICPRIHNTWQIRVSASSEITLDLRMSETFIPKVIALSLIRYLHFVQFKLSSYQGCIYTCLSLRLSLNLFLGLWCGGIPVFSSPKKSYFGILLIIIHTTRSFNRIWLNIVIISMVLRSYIWQKTVSGTEDFDLMLRMCIRHCWRNH